MAHGNAKLTDNAVREIRRLRTEGMTYEQISNQFGVCEATIGNIVTGKIWKHVA
jgi:IS30 family transposase